VVAKKEGSKMVGESGGGLDRGRGGGGGRGEGGRGVKVGAGERGGEIREGIQEVM